MAKTEKHPHRSGFCITGHCDDCPHAFSVTRRDGQGYYTKEWTCECVCHTAYLTEDGVIEYGDLS